MPVLHVKSLPVGFSIIEDPYFPDEQFEKLEGFQEFCQNFLDYAVEHLYTSDNPVETLDWIMNYDLHFLSFEHVCKVIECYPELLRHQILWKWANLEPQSSRSAER